MMEVKKIIEKLEELKDVIERGKFVKIKCGEDWIRVEVTFDFEESEE